MNSKTVLKVKLYLSRQKRTMNKTFIFFKIVPPAFKVLIPVSIPLDEALLKIYF